jgi:hypothetical protein
MKGGVTKELDTKEHISKPVYVPNSERKAIRTIKGVLLKNDYCLSGRYEGKDWVLESHDGPLSVVPKVQYWTLDTYSEYGARNFVIETANHYPEIILALMNWTPFQDMLDRLDPDSDRFENDKVELNMNTALMLIANAINESKTLIEVKLAGMLK